MFIELTGESTLQVIDLQLNNSGQEQTVVEIKSMLNDSIMLLTSVRKMLRLTDTF